MFNLLNLRSQRKIDLYIDQFENCKVQMEISGYNPGLVKNMVDLATHIPHLNGWPAKSVFWDDEAFIWRDRIGDDVKTWISNYLGKYSGLSLALGSGSESYSSDVCLDISANMLNSVNSPCKVLGDAELSLPFKSGVFEICCLVFVINYIQNWDNLIKEIARILKKGGNLIIIQTKVNNYHQILNRMKDGQILTELLQRYFVFTKIIKVFDNKKISIIDSKLR